MINKIRVIFFAFLSPVLLLAQDAPPEEMKGSLRLTFMVPQPTANKAFNKAFTGIFDAGMELNYNIGKVVLGGYGRYKMFQVKGSRANKIITTQQNTVSTGITVGLDYYKTQRTIITPFINVGYNFIHYSRISYINEPPKVVKTNGINIEPGCRINWLIDEGFGMGFCFSYTLLTNEFNPYDVSLHEFQSYDQKEINGLTQFFSFGFCVVWDWSKRPESDY